MRRGFWCFVPLWAIFNLYWFAAMGESRLEPAWTNAPEEARSRVYWRWLYKHAVSEAHRLGLKISLNIQSG